MAKNDFFSLCAFFQTFVPVGSSITDQSSRFIKDTILSLFGSRCPVWLEPHGSLDL